MWELLNSRNNAEKTAILLLHGIMGTPRHFDFLLPYIPDSMTVRPVLLDGHGGSARNFSRTSMAKWRAQVEAEAEALCRTHDRVLIAAHSMGTLLAIEAALRHVEIKQLFLFAVPLRAAPKPRAFRNGLKACLCRDLSGDPAARAAKEACSVAVDWRLWRCIGFLPRFFELFSAMRSVRKRLSDLKTPAIAFQSGREELVSQRSTELLKRVPAIEVYTLPRSGHFFYEKEEKAQLIRAFQAVVNKFEKEELP